MSSSFGDDSDSIDGILNTLVKYMKDYPVLLDKSQLPKVKERKQEALKLLVKLYAKNDVIIDEKSCLKNFKPEEKGEGQN